MIIPSIDLMDGKAVQLQQGKKKMLEREDVMGLAKEFGRYGEIAVIDLDAAMEKGDNIDLIKQIVKVANCRVGGGIRSVEKGRELLRSGAKKIIIGTAASESFLSEFRREDVIVAIDTRGGMITDKGWQRDTDMTPKQMIERFKDYCGGFLFTNVDKEGRLEGFDVDLAAQIRKLVPKKCSLTVAGGITTIEEIQSIEKLNADCQVGMSIYTGKIQLDEAYASIIDFEKNNGLVPTIVQEENGTVLMLAYSSQESLRMALTQGAGVYYSRSRNSIWIKGEESGNTQELLNVRYDCDRDTLLFTVRQKGVACHMGTYSCFTDDEAFTLSTLHDTLRARMQSGDASSYTYRLSRDEKAIMDKIAEESGEVINYKDRENLVWEISDLAYFLLVLMAKKGIDPKEIITELRGRRR
ncbi:MAG: bifunctional phosphoribosyl-AMP cyclohydrolase/phosphoribosyl-ATP diphosphatase HisIE [Candidatus Methanofastidiosia archaeon]